MLVVGEAVVFVWLWMGHLCHVEEITVESISYLPPASRQISSTWTTPKPCLPPNNICHVEEKRIRVDCRLPPAESLPPGQLQIISPAKYLPRGQLRLHSRARTPAMKLHNTKHKIIIPRPWRPRLASAHQTVPYPSRASR